MDKVSVDPHALVDEMLGSGDMTAENAKQVKSILKYQEALATMTTRPADMRAAENMLNNNPEVRQLINYVITTAAIATQEATENDIGSAKVIIMRLIMDVYGEAVPKGAIK